MSREMSRRQFLRVGALAAAGTIVAACGATPTPVPPTATKPPAATATTAPAAAAPTATKPPAAAPTATTASAAAPTATTGAAAAPGAYKESPIWAAMVKDGKLPPVAQRLPKNPCVMVSYEGTGKYGGLWRRATDGVSDRTGPKKLIDRDWAWLDAKLNLIPRLMESWSFSPDAKIVTVKIREGTKWSDGSPFTSDDIAWWHKYILLNKTLTPTPAEQWRDSDKTPVKFAAPDKFTLQFTYGEPHPMFMFGMLRSGVNDPTYCSKYLMQFHQDTTTDKAALDADIKKRGYDSWKSYFDTTNGFAKNFSNNPDMPLLTPWKATNSLSNEVFNMERQPYYWAVDKDGNQLPFIDKVTHRLYQSSEVLNLWVTNGEIDMQQRKMSIANMPLYKSGEAKGDYKTTTAVGGNSKSLQLNLTTKNAKLAEVFNDLKFRQAVSMAIDRDGLNQLVYNGMYKPRQYSPIPMSPQYYPKLSNSWIKYDPAAANKLLDEAGYTKKDADGIRLFKDGSGPISFIIEGTAQTGDPDDDAAQQISKYLAKVGIKGTYKYAERTLYTKHQDSNDLDAAYWGGDRLVLPLVPKAIIFRGVQQDRPWCVAWTHWYLDPTRPAAVKPPDGHWIWDIWNIWDKEVVVEPDPDKATKAFFKILDIWAEQLPMIGLLGEEPIPTIVKNGFKGYPAGMPSDDPIGDEQFCQSETYYWDDPSKHPVT